MHRARAIRGEHPAQPDQERFELIPAAVHVTDDVERAGQLAAVVEQLLVADFHVLGVVENVDFPEALPPQLTQGSSQVPMLALEHIPAEIPVRTGPGAFPAHRFRDVEDNRHRQHIVFPGDRD